MLVAPLSKVELYRTIHSMSLDKTPGIDGIPVEFYIENWNAIGDDLLILYNCILNIGILGDSQKKGIITLIPKTKDILYIINYRPISLLCVD